VPDEHGESGGSRTSGAGDGCLGNGGSDDDGDGGGDGDGDGDDNYKETGLELVTAASKKKRKRNKKKKKIAASNGSAQTQSSPPRVPLSELFPSGDFPEGEVQQYVGPRTKTSEVRYLARQAGRDENFLPNYRKAAEVHRQARQYIQSTVKPGDTLLNIAEGIEDSVRALLGHAGLETGDALKAGIGFPTGICLNHQVAHYTPNPREKDVVLQHSDIMTIDFGVHINGWIVDSAFTMAFDPVYDDLLAAVKDATNSGIQVRIVECQNLLQTDTYHRQLELMSALATSVPPYRKQWKATK
jgi:methionyl aminopeptidase